MAVSKEDLFKVKLTEEEVELEGVGAVRVRALTRSEALAVRGLDLTVEEMERKLLAIAMVEPSLTEDEVGQWQAASAAGVMEPLMLRVVELSGMGIDAAKVEMQRFRDGA